MQTQPTPAFRNVHLVLNPGSGSFDGIDALPIHPAWTVHRVGDEGPYELAQRAVAQGADLVIAGGGDGTVNGAAHGLLGSDAVLGIVPMGTANVLATALGIPADPSDAMELLATADATCVRTIDGGRYGDDAFFMLRLGLGIEASMVAHSDDELKAKVGRLAYFKTFVHQSRAQQPVRYRIVADGQRHEARGVTCLICNTGHVGLRGMDLLPSVAIDDGRLTVVVIRRLGVWVLFLLLLSALKSGLMGRGFHVEHSKRLRLYPGREVEVTSDPPQEAACDGDALDDALPIRASVRPGALRVVVPQATRV
jgi:diacylglycerol kinase family enzyme